MNQIVVRDGSGRDYPIPIFQGMTRERLKSEIANRGISDIKEVCGNVAPELSNEWKELVADVCDLRRVANDEMLDPQCLNVCGRIEFEFSGRYFQAIAKIAFHHYLTYNRRGYSGNELSFSRIRKFIRYGGDKDEFFHRSDRHFAVPFGETATGIVCPKDWCHILGVNEVQDVVVTYSQFNVGPGNIPEGYYITLGQVDNRIVLPNGVWGHAYQVEDGRRDRFAGTMHECSMTPLTSTNHQRWQRA